MIRPLQRKEGGIWITILWLKSEHTPYLKVAGAMNYHNVLTRSWNIRRNIIFVSITCMVSTLTLLASTALADRTYAGRLIYGHGKIDRLTSMDGQHQPITTDNVIRPGDIIRTGPNGRAAILCADESLIRLHSNTALSFEHVAQTAVWIDPADRADGVSAKRASTYQLMAGELWLRNKSRHLVITVKAAHLNATLRGTELDLLMLPENVVAMTVQEGLVIASNRHGSMGVKQLEKIIARPGEPIEKQMLLSSEGTVQWTLTIVYVDLGPSDPALPDVSLQAQTFLKDEIVTYQLQAQQMIKTPSHQLSLGGIHLWGNENADYDTLFYLSFQGDSYPQTTMTTHSRMNNKSSSFYIRDLWRITDRLMLDSALYYDQIRNTSAVSNTKWDIDLIGPRVGVIYSLTERDTLRLAGFRYLVPFATDRVDSPEIAGIPIFRYTMEGTIANEANGVWEHEWQTGCVTSGVYYVEKKMEQYLGSAADQEKTVDNGSLKGVYASVNQLVPGGCGAAATYHFWETKDDILSPATGCGHCVDHLATIGVKYVAPIGFSTGIKEIYRHTNFRKDSRDSESIFITDIEMGYELPNKHARIRFQVENLFDDTFNWVATLGPWARHPTRQWLLSVECDI